MGAALAGGLSGLAVAPGGIGSLAWVALVPLLLGIRGRASGETDDLASVDKARAERIRELVRIVQETGIGEVTIEEDGMRVSVRAAQEEPVETENLAGGLTWSPATHQARTARLEGASAAIRTPTCTRVTMWESR